MHCPTLFCPGKRSGVELWPAITHTSYYPFSRNHFFFMSVVKMLWRGSRVLQCEWAQLTQKGEFQAGLEQRYKNHIAPLFAIDDVCCAHTYRKKPEGNRTEIQICCKEGLNLVQRIKLQCANVTDPLQRWGIHSHVTIKSSVMGWKQGKFVTFIFFQLKWKTGMLQHWELTPMGRWLSSWAWGKPSHPIWDRKSPAEGMTNIPPPCQQMVLFALRPKVK